MIISSIHKYFPTLFVAIFVLLSTGSCIEDGITTSPSDQPTFSVDTLKIGYIFTEETTPTFAFKVYNKHDKILSISSIGFPEEQNIFRLNVDGQSGSKFHNIEIRPNDSIFVFVDVTLPANNTYLPVDIEQTVQFVTNGVTSSVIITAQGQDVVRERARIISADEVWTAEQPRQIFDTIVVAEGATLTLKAGTRIFFHDKSSLLVRGTLKSEGTADAPVHLSGDRTGNVITDVTFDLMSRQWQGVTFAPTSHDNHLEFTEIRNTWTGVVVDSITPAQQPALTMINCRLRNADGHVFSSYHSWIKAVGCEFAEAGAGSVYIQGGQLDMDYCTVSNYYLFSVIRGANIQLHHINQDTKDESGLPYLTADINNCIIYGSSADMTPGTLDNTNVYVRRCLFRSQGSDDTRFINCVWGEDPLFYTIRNEYIFDYRLQPESPAIGQAYTRFSEDVPTTDFYGTRRPYPASIGAYEPIPETNTTF